MKCKGQGQARWLGGLWIFLSLLVGTASQAQVAIDGYNRGAGNLDVAISYSYEEFKDFYLGDERNSLELFGFDSIVRQSTSLNLIYGLTDWVDIQISLPYIDVAASGPQSVVPPDLSGVQDLYVLLKTHLWHSGSGRWSVFGSVGFKTFLDSYEDDEITAVGHLSRDIEERLLLQYVNPSGFFLSAQTGYSFRSHEVPDAIPFFAKTGFSRGRLYFDAWLDIQESRGGVDVGEEGFTFPATKVDWLRAGGRGCYWAFGKTAVCLGVGQTLDGRNVARSRWASLGLAYRIQR